MSHDVSAQWLYRSLKERGADRLALITAETLASSLRWEFQLNSAGAVIDITLADRRRLFSDDIRGVINRVFPVYPVYLELLSESEKRYAMQEFLAFYAAWLYALPGKVINRPAAHGLCGRWRHISEWNYLAARVGLPVKPYRESVTSLISCSHPGEQATTADTVIVIEGLPVSVGPLSHSSEIMEGCRRLAAAAETELLGITFHDDGAGGWVFDDATPYPDLSLGGAPLLDRFFDLMRSSLQ